ncbi:MAG TPA: hypothetical protein VHA70_06280 [Bauldia sp.]|nr:hypothetical protein [Bauldia sp.]
MNDRTKLSLVAAALAVTGVALAPAFATVAPAGQLFVSGKPAGIAIEAPTSANGLGTIWFDIGSSDVSFGGPR